MQAKFLMGTLVATSGALKALSTTNTNPVNLLQRHIRGDWGMVCAEDKRNNDEGIKLGNRLLSAYPIDLSKPCKGFGPNTVWIITEHDRSVTTILLPEEY